VGRILTPLRWLALALLPGCIDWDAAGKCYGDASCASTERCTGASRCSGLAAPICEGFEDPLLSPLWYVFDNPPAATVTLDASRACRGGSSLHVHVDALAAGASARTQIQEHQSEQPTPLVDRWIRLFAYVPAASITPAHDHVVNVAQSDLPYRSITFGVAGGVLAVHNEFSIGASPVYSRTKWPADRWVCLGYHIRQGSPGQIQVSIDDVPVADLELSDETNPSPPLSTILFGAAFDSIPAAQDSVDLWIDEITVSGSPLDCGS